MLNFISNYRNHIFFLLIIILGSSIRFLSIGHQDLWYDEILTFSIASDQINLYESHFLSTQLDGTPYLFNLILKTFFHIFTYDIVIGKIFLSIISAACILSTSYLTYILSKDNSYIFAAFLTSLNVFLLDYSSELRVYTFMYFFSSLSIIFYLKSLKAKKNKNFIIFSFISTINSFLHPFSLLIYISFIIHLSILFIKKKFMNKKLIISLLVILILNIFYFVYYYIFTDNIKEESWIQNVDIDFYYHYFFANFFGSRILGVIFLLTLLFLVFKNYFYKKNNQIFLVILILITYIFPLSFSYLIKPIFIPRYIIFVLIPIITLISILLFQLKNKTLKNSLITFLILIVSLNTLNETSFKKIYKHNYLERPQFAQSLKIIGLSDHKSYTIKFSHIIENKKQSTLKIYNLYLKHLSKKLNLNTKYISENSYLKNSKTLYWIICDPIINKFNCSLEKNLGVKLIENINLYKLNLKLVEKI